MKWQMGHVPLWFGVVWAGFIFLGFPRVLLAIFDLLGWRGVGGSLAVIPFQAVLAFGVFFFLSADNTTRKSLLRFPVRPIRIAGTIFLAWVSVLFVVSGVLFAVAIVLNAATGGEVARQFYQDMGAYQVAYGGLFYVIEGAGFWQQMGIALLIAGIVPLTEEWLFRGVLFDGLARHISSGLVIVVQALLFASLHPLGFYTVLYVCIGILLGWLRHRFSSLWPAIWAHQFQNLIAFSSFLLGGREIYSFDSSLLDMNQLVYALPLVGVFGVLAFFSVRALLRWETTTATQRS